MEEHETPNVSLATCMHFVRRGVAKAVPEKIEISEKELEAIIKQTKRDLRIIDEGDDSDDSNAEDTQTAEDNAPENPEDEFNFDKYDEEEDNTAGIESVATIPNLGDLPDNVNIRTEGVDSDEEDDLIKPDDNLLLVGHVESDASVLEVFVYNAREDSFYVHHDVVLPWFPLCIEWLSHDPSDPQPGNLCALGGMDPVIQVWDLDIENVLEPVFKLGRKPNKRKKVKRVGHRDAVLDLSWNRNFTHVMASGSADSTILLWDLDQGTPHTKLKYFGDKVQSVEFHPREAQTLASGCSDGVARVSDCRSDDAVREWGAAGEIERVAWHPARPFCFAMSTSVGGVSYVDVRSETPLWSVHAHDGEVTGLVLTADHPDLMVTVGADGKLSTWDIGGDSATRVSERTLRVGKALCAAACPDAPLTVAVGGDDKQKYTQLVDLRRSPEVMSHFNLHAESAEQMEA